MRDKRSRAYGSKTRSVARMVCPERIELEPFCGRERIRGPRHARCSHGRGGGAGARRRNPERSEGSESRGVKEKLVRPERIELPTSWFVAKHSIQLSYGRIMAELCLRIITEQNRFAQPRSSNTLADKNL